MLYGNTALGYTAKDLNKPSNKTSIESFYKQHLGREADAGGVAHYQSLLNKGASLSSIQSSIRNSNEAKSRYNTGIQSAAKEALGRNLGTSGASYFNNAVSSGTGSLAQAREAIYNSPEAQRYTAKQQIARQYADEKKSSDDGLAALAAGLNSLTGGFQSSMEALSASLAEQQAGYSKSLQEMMNTLTASMNPNTTEKVLGVKSAGDESAMTIKKQKQGVKGTFGRSGLRIKGLNI
jgi:hypothetical protein